MVPLRVLAGGFLDVAPVGLVEGGAATEFGRVALGSIVCHSPRTVFALNNV